MDAAESELSGERPVLLSSGLAGRGERQVALAFVLASAAVFLIAAPLARVQLPSVWAFIPAYQSALVVNDLITAAFLYSQFRIAGSRPLLLLASGYLFTASMAAVHALTFPGLFAPTGLLGAGPQTTAWLYMLWHAGFPLLVIAYARWSARDRAPQPRGGARRAMLLSVAAVLVAALSCTLFAILSHDAIPAIMQGNAKTPANLAVVGCVWLLSLAALYALWRRRPHSVLDLWLTVVMCAWLFDIALSAVLNAGRFDLGFYIGRIYGMLAASFVLVVLLLEHARLYGELIRAHASDRRKAIELERLSTMDPLTRIANRRAFETALEREWRRAMRHDAALSLLMVDVDCFKAFNDAYGHVAGDACLRAIAGALADGARRAGDLVARYGGEEFAVLLPQTGLAEAHQLAERMGEAVRGLHMGHAQSSAGDQVTISVGVATAFGPRGIATRRAPTVLVEAADRALYQAKAAGRDRTHAWDGDEASLPPMPATAA